jgi:hypothetical protein
MKPQGVAAGEALPGVTALVVERAATVDAAAVCRMLAHPIWLGVPSSPPPDRPGMQRVETDLVLPLDSKRSRLTFSKAAYVDMAVTPGPNGCVAEIGWRAVSFAPLFPVFSGRLEVTPTGLRLSGFYAPPGGGVGLLVDRTFLHFVARRTGEWFLERIAAGAAG